jgi:hypothetical protein
MKNLSLNREPQSLYRPLMAFVIGAAFIAFLLGLSSHAGAGSRPTCFGRKATIVGTRGDDVLIGTSGSDVIVGRDGQDRIHGRGGQDFMWERGVESA